MIAETLLGGISAAVKWTTGHPSMDRALGWLVAPTVSGVDVTDNSALTYSAVWAATRILSTTGSGLPLNISLEDGQGISLDKSHEAFGLFNSEPNDEMSAKSFRTFGFIQQINSGNFYAEIERTGNGRPFAMHPIHSSRVEMIRVDEFGRRSRNGRIAYAVHGDNITYLIASHDMLHIPSWMTNDGIVGKGVISAARESIGFGLAAEQYGSAFFGKGAVPPVVLMHKSKLSKEARENIRSDWLSVHQGADKQQVPGVLWEGMDLKVIGINGKDSQFLESRQHQVEEIARWYGVPPHMIGDLRRSTNNNIEHQGMEFVQYALIPWLEIWEQEIHRKLFSQEEKGRYIVRHDVDELLRGDFETRTKAKQIQCMTGEINLDEWRASEGKNPLPNGIGQHYFMPVNITTLERIINGTAGKEAQAATLPPAADDARAVRLQEATYGVLRDAVERMLVWEIEAADRASNSPNDFIGKMDKFYEAHEGRCVRAWRAPLAAHRVSLGQEPDEVALVSLAKVHVETSKVQLFAAAECAADELVDKVAECIGRWAEERSNIDLGAIECLT